MSSCSIARDRSSGSGAVRVELLAAGGASAQAGGVERQAMQRVVLAEQAIVLAFAVADVADDGTRNVLQVPADLVQAPAVGPRFDPGVTAELSEPDDVGDGGLRHVAVVGAERVIDDDGFGRRAAYQRDVALFDLVLFEALAKYARGVGRQAEQQDAAGSAIQPMHRIHPLPEQSRAPASSRRRHRQPSRDAQQAGRLVDGHDVGVAIENLDVWHRRLRRTVEIRGYC